jgi:glycosyltransferase involved in cell wall biosynthesis
MTPQEGLSIVIVTYNAASTLQQCLDSIYAQSYAPINIIIIDGKSTDGTVAILAENQHRFQYWISEKDKGVYDAMNKALPHINTRFVYFLGADDELLPAFSTFAAQATNNDTIYYANVLADNKVRLGYLSPYQMAKVGIYHQAMIYPKTVFDKYRYNLKYNISADYALNIQCYGDKQFSFIYKDLVIAKFNHTGISGFGADKAFKQDKSRMILQNFGFKVWLKYTFRQLKRAVKGVR